LAEIVIYGEVSILVLNLMKGAQRDFIPFYSCSMPLLKHWVCHVTSEAAHENVHKDTTTS
jgi:hypothetical protein